MSWISTLPFKCAFYSIILLIVGWIIARRCAYLAEKFAKKRFSLHFAKLIRRVIFYFIFIGFLVSSLQQLGFDLTVLIGAAGVLTVGLSFASQTAASNLISGLFMIFERPYSLGDSIEVKGIIGTVEAIDLLSTKLKTADNRLVRVPNETMIKSEIINYSYFPTRRIDLIIGISYENDIEKAKQACLAVSKTCPGILENPEATIIVNGFADSAIELKFMVWVQRTELLKVKSELQQMIKKRFDEENIEIPYPQLTISKAS